MFLSWVASSLQKATQVCYVSLDATNWQPATWVEEEPPGLPEQRGFGQVSLDGNDDTFSYHLQATKMG
jgi:hypothetical protein